MSNENYLVREVGTNHTQIVHRIRLRSYTPTHKIVDIPNIDKNNFVTDPKFPDEYKQPALFDRTQHRLLWHPKMSDAPETDDINPDQTQQDHYDTIYLRKPQVRLQRLPANIDNTTLQPRKYDSIHTYVPIKLATPDTTIKRILKPTAANTNQGPFIIHMPYKRSMPTSPITKVRDNARKVVEASIPRIILRRIKAKREESKLKVAIIQHYSEVRPTLGELSIIPEEPDEDSCLRRNYFASPSKTGFQTMHSHQSPPEKPVTLWQDPTPPSDEEDDSPTLKLPPKAVVLARTPRKTATTTTHATPTQPSPMQLANAHLLADLEAAVSSQTTSVNPTKQQAQHDADRQQPAKPFHETLHATSTRQNQFHETSTRHNKLHATHNTHNRSRDTPTNSNEPWDASLR